MTVLVICRMSGLTQYEKAGMRVRTIESPCHQLLDNQENDNSGDVVLDRHC